MSINFVEQSQRANHYTKAPPLYERVNKKIVVVLDMGMRGEPVSRLNTAVLHRIWPQFQMPACRILSISFGNDKF